ncbi:hypothetical protein DPMN_141558 [Dreissena polymorpha]|uniref:Uncharacterized protein n=1 Tax=Dreissena polymorpha TaxID=45954 RepID=A0A9D4JLD3_DREPO|nr:hypothetical protein DPMN_141558 [Dreissena polymorpha]
MTVQLTTSKCEDIINMGTSVTSKKRVPLHQFAKLIGKLVAARPGVQHAPLFIKPLEKEKELSLKKHKGIFKSSEN